MAQLELALFLQDKIAIMRGCQPILRASLAYAFQTGQKCQAKFIVSPDQPGHTRPSNIHFWGIKTPTAGWFANRTALLPCPYLRGDSRLMPYYVFSALDANNTST